MTKYTFANLDEWVKKNDRIMDAILKQSANDLMVLASRTAPGKARGGSVQVGKVPRDTGFLAASLVSRLNGGTALSGANSYIFVAGKARAGDVLDFGWTAVYARIVHYRGWMWVDESARQWKKIVERNTKRARAAFS